MHTYIRQSGVTLIEVLIAVSIIATMLVVIGFSVTTYVEARSHLLNDAKAAYLAEEGYEILRALRDNDWNTIDGLTIGTTQYLEVSTTTLAIGSMPEVIEGEFSRSFVVEEVYRNSDDDIVPSTTAGATVDNDSRLITISVGGPTATTSFSAILTNIHAI